MNTVPDYGGMWKQYKLIGDDYVNAGFPQDALDYGYGQALELCELGALPGKDGLRKKTKILLKIAEAHTE